MTIPNLICGEFMYEEGEGLEDDEREEYEEMLVKPLAALPGNGISNGSIVTVQSQIQHFSCKLVISHQVYIASQISQKRLLHVHIERY